MNFIPSLNKDKPGYHCPCCGRFYDEMPLCFGTDFPDYYYSVPEHERESRIEISESLCAIDNQYFFHRGQLSIPITDYDEHLIFNVWTTISEENFRHRMTIWEDPNRIKEEPYFGWLQTILPSYGDTINIQTIAIEQEPGTIPEIKCIEDGHALTIDQENGITFKKAIEIVDYIMREDHQSSQN